MASVWSQNIETNLLFGRTVELHLYDGQALGRGGCRLGSLPCIALALKPGCLPVEAGWVQGKEKSPAECQRVEIQPTCDSKGVTTNLLPELELMAMHVL